MEIYEPFGAILINGPKLLYDMLSKIFITLADTTTQARHRHLTVGHAAAAAALKFICIALTVPQCRPVRPTGLNKSQK